MKKLLFFLVFFAPQLLSAQSSDCSTATPFCTETSVNFPASTNATAPIGPDYGCLFTQPNPAFFQLEMSQPGDITITMQSTFLSDIDFICWGPFNDPATMCDSLTVAYIEDCSYSGASIEDCDITNAVAGQFYVLLITNYSNFPCDIDFSQTSGNAATDCCILGNAGEDNNFTECNSISPFIMENELNGSPSSGGVWYDDTWNVVSNNFDPAIETNGTYAYIVQGAPVTGTTVTCPDDTAFLVINMLSCIDVSLTSSEASCFGNDGSITATPDSPLPSWDIALLDINGTFLTGSIANGASFTYTNLFPGTYIVKITDNLNNSSQDTILVSQIVSLFSIYSNPIGVSCYNGDNGQVGIWPSAGLAPYTFLIDGDTILNAFPLDSLVENLSAGSYVVSVIDDNNCMLRDTVIITSPTYPLQTLVSSKAIACTGASLGIAIGSAAGGTPGYIYSWYEGGNPVSFSDNDTVVGLSAGSYYLSVEDANGCDTFTTVNIIEPQFALQGSVQIFGVPCKGDSTGMLVGDAGGGWGPYAYYWLDAATGDTLQYSLNHVAERDTLFDLSSGIYQLHIYDIKGCFVPYTLNVPEPSVALSIDSVVLVESISCYSDSVGKAILYASGGMPNLDPNYAYLWDNGEITIIADGLTSGYHSVTLSDDWGCEVLDSIYIPENPLIESDLTTVQDVSCYGYTNGVANISSVGGFSSVYTYFWSQGQQTVGVNFDMALGLLQGSYYVTTRDALGCEVVDSIYISEPEPLSMEAFELDWIDCYNAEDGFAGATATGGTLAYVFDWDNGQWVGDTITTLTSGLHTVVVTDARGCTSSDTVVIHNPDSLYINIDDALTILPYCIGVNTASLSANAYGGTLGYTYEWDDNVSLPQTTTTATALLAGTYTITVTDSKGCTASDRRDIDTITNTMGVEVISLIQYVGGNDISCFGYNDGGAEVIAEGGHAPYTYQWFGGSSATTYNINNLYAGTYSVIVRDTNNCMVNGSVPLTEPSALTFNTSINTSESCLGACDGKILIDSLSGGVASYTGLLTDNLTGSVSTHSIVSNYILDVCSGSYTVSLIDANDCPSTVISGGQDQQFINYGPQTQAQINVISSIDTICYASSTGLLNVLNPNTSTGYSYSWHDLSGNTVSTDNPAISLPAGVYVLYADYNNTAGIATPGCTTYDTLEIIEYSAITNSVTIDHVDCYGYSDGKITAEASSGVPAPLYSYSWNTNPVQNTPQATGLSAGTYVCTVTDNNDCTNEFEYIVNESEEIDLNVTIINTYTLTATVLSGGLPPYTYEWFELPSTLVGSALSYTVSANGSYYVNVTDANGCVQSSSITSFGTTSVSDLSTITLSIYPNPFKNETTVDFGREIQTASIRVVDVFGKLIEEHNIENTDKHILKRENKASGIYFVEIEVEQQEKMIYKLIVE